MLDATTRLVIVVASVVLALIGACVGCWRWQRGKRIPGAQVIGAKARRWTAVPVACVALGLFGFGWAVRHDVAVMVVSDGDSRYGNRALERKLASSLDDFPVAIGDRHWDPLIGDECWIVNTSSRPLRRVRIEYPDKPRSHYIEVGTITIEPGQRSSGCEVDYFGTMFGPPETTEEMATARLNFASWLTWD